MADYEILEEDDIYDLINNDFRLESFIRITCPEDVDIDTLIKQFRAGLIKAKDEYFNVFFEKYTTDKYQYSVPDELNIRLTRKNNVLIGKYIKNRCCEIYGEDVPWIIDFGFDVVETFVSEFFNKPEFKDCKYENVFVTSQAFSVQDSTTVAISSNIENNDYEYSFNRVYKRLLRDYLEDERREYSENDIYLFIRAEWMNLKNLSNLLKPWIFQGYMMMST